MIGGMDSIDDMDVLRARGNACAVWRGAGAAHAGCIPALVHLGKVWLAEAITGHLADEKHDPAGRAQRLVPRKTMSGSGVRFRGQDR